MSDNLKNEKHLKLEPLDTDRFIKANELKPISNPVFFDRNGIPSADGLLSNEIFGITKDDRSTIFAYVELAGESFMHPLAYKIWCRLDSNVKLCVYEMDTFKLDKETGKLVSDPKGETGLKFLKKIITKVDFKRTQSAKRGVKIDFLEKFKDKLFTNNLIVIPAGYRDLETDNTRIGIGEINKLYDSIIRDVNALKESEDYGLSINGSIRGRIQDNLVAIYDWICFGRFNGVDAQASGLAKKLGLIRRAGMKKSFDWGARLVICTQNLRVEDLDDLEVDVDEVGLPLTALCANFFPYMVYWIRKWFEVRFNDMKYTRGFDLKLKDEMVNIEMQDWRLVYSDERIKKELDRFMHGLSNRFVPIEAPVTDEFISDYRKKVKRPDARLSLAFKGTILDTKETINAYKEGKISDISSYPMAERPLTWCDLIYQAAKDIAKDKMTLITRFPMDSYWNQFPAKIKVLSTINTEPMVINGILFEKYPKIRIEDLFTNTTNKFVDIALPNNARLDSFGADFDGDTISSKVPYSIEASEELYNAVKGKKHYIGLDGINAMKVTKEGIQSLYNLTLVLPEQEKILTPTNEIEFE